MQDENFRSDPFDPNPEPQVASDKPDYIVDLTDESRMQDLTDAASVIGKAGMPARTQAIVPVEDDTSAALRAAAAQMRDQRRSALMSSLYTSVDQNPDKAAEQQRLADQFSVRAEFFARNEGEMRKRLLLDQIDNEDLPNTSPVLAEQMSNPEFAAVAHDDVKNLKDEEGLWGWTAAQIMGIPDAFNHGRAMYREGEWGAQQVAGDPALMETWYTQEDIDAQRKRLEAFNKELESYGHPHGIAQVTADTVGMMWEDLRQKAKSILIGTGTGATVGAGAGTVFPLAEPVTVTGGALSGAGIAYRAATMESAFRQTAGMIYTRALGEGADPEAARQAAIAGGLAMAPVHYAIDKILKPGLASGAEKAALREEIDRRVADATVKPAMSAALRRITAESGKIALRSGALGAVQATGFEIANEIALHNSGKEMRISSAEGRKEIADNVWEMSKYMMLASVGMHVLTPGVKNPIMEMYREKQRIDLSERQNQFFERLYKITKDSRLASRSPDAYERFVQGNVSGSGMQDTLVSKAGVRDVMREMNIPIERLDEFLPGGLKQYEDPSSGTPESGGYIRVNTAGFMARVSKTEFGRRLMPHVTFDAEVGTAHERMQREAFRKEFNEHPEEFATQVEEALANDDAMQESANRVAESQKQQLIKVGHTEEDAAAMALFVSKFAAAGAKREGITPEEFHKRYPVSVGMEKPSAPSAETAPMAKEAQGESAAPQVGAKPSVGQLSREGHDAIMQAVANAREARAAHETIAESEGVVKEGRSTPTSEMHRAFEAAMQDVEDAARDGDLKRLSAAIDGLQAQLSETRDARNAVKQPGIAKRLASTAQRVIDAAREELDRIEGQPLTQEGVLEQPLTTMIPTVKSAEVTPTDVRIPSLAEATTADEKHEAALDKNVALVDTKTFTRIDKKTGETVTERGYNSIKVEGADAREQAESIITQMVRNLRAIYNSVPKTIRQRSKLWYVGAKRLSLVFARRYGLSDMQSAAGLAVLSPQADWRMNVSYFERILDIMRNRGSHKWDENMTAWADGYVEEHRKDWETAIQEAEANRAIAQTEYDAATADIAKHRPSHDQIVSDIAAREQARDSQLQAIDARIDAANAMEETPSHQRDVAIAKAAKERSAAAATKKEKAAINAEAKQARARRNATEETALALRKAAREEKRALQDKFAVEQEAERASLAKAQNLLREAETRQRQAERDIAKQNSKANAARSNFLVQEDIRGKTFNELETDFARAWWIRSYDEAHHPRHYRDVSPEGAFLDFVKTSKGNDDKIAWKSFAPIAKAVSIIRDGSVENISKQLGGEHKVRNFYNNIFDPFSKKPFLTSDTHNVAAALLLPLGASAIEVSHNFGTGKGVGSVGPTGLNGTYWMYAEAAARAAEAEGILPREMQSITWEAVRGLFIDTFKSQDANVDAVRDIWDEYRAGKKTYEEAFNAIVEFAGGFRNPSWVGVGPDRALPAEQGASSYESGLVHAVVRAEPEQPGADRSRDGGDVGSDVSEREVLNQEAPIAAPTQLMAVHNLSEENLAFADKMGGLAVPSVGVVSREKGGVEGFGEITLIGTKGLAAPETSRVFESDAYSARFPQAEWPKVPVKTADATLRPLREWAKKFDDDRMLDITFDRMVNKPDAQAVAGEWRRSNAIKAMFLHQRGVDVEPVMREAKPLIGLSWDAVERLRPLYKAIDQNRPWDEVIESQEYRNLETAYANEIRKQFEPLKDEGFDDARIDRMASFTGNTLSRIGRDLDTTERIKVNRLATQEALDAALEPYQAEFKNWVDSTVKENFDEPFIKVGRTKRPYTLGNIVDAMTSQRVKGEEKGMTFGAGAARAAAAREFSSLEEMRAAAQERLASPEEYGKTRRESETLLENYRNVMLKYFMRTDWRGQIDTWDGLDGSMRALARYGNREQRSPKAMRAALSREGFSTDKIPDEVVEQAIDAAVALFTAPVPYFEAKPQRAVRLGEFPGAVIPWNASQETRDVLARNNITAIEYEPGNEQARQNAVRELTASLSERHETLFQAAPERARGSFNPRTWRITLNERSDMSTFLHETSHYFFESYSEMVRVGTASEQVRADFRTLLNWFGVKDEATWFAMTFEERRKLYEQFSYNFEIFLSEGKAPTIELQPVFDRFAAWLKAVYKDIRGELNDIYKAKFGTDLPILTGEVRQVMDRMLASEEQITRSEEARDMKAMFQTQEESGMNDAEWAAYKQMLEEAHQAAVTDLTAASIRQMQWLGNAQSRVMREMQAKNRAIRKDIRDKVEEEVRSEPVYRAMDFLKYGMTVSESGERVPVDTPAKLDVRAVKAILGEEAGAKLGYGKYGMLAKEGLPPDVVAEMFGFASGEEFVKALAEARKPKEEIEARTDARVLKEHGDLNDPDKMDAAVNAALHNEARARFVAVELRYLAKATQPVATMVAAARDAARDHINNRKIKDIKVNDFVSAEARAARDAMGTAGVSIDPEKSGKTIRTRVYNKSIEAGMDEAAATAAADKAGAEAKARAEERLKAHKAKYGDRTPEEVARRAKQQQLFQNQLAAEAGKVKDEIGAAVKDFRKFFGPDAKIGKSREIEMVMAARAILASFGFGRSEKAPNEYVKQIQAFNPDLYAALEPIIERTTKGAQDYRELTVNEFRALKDAVDALWNDSRRDKQIVVGDKRVAVEQAVGELVGRLNEIGVPDVLPGQQHAPTFREKTMRTLNGVKNIMRRVEHWCDAVDGMSNVGGAFTRYIFRPVKDALDNYRADRNKYLKKYGDLCATIEIPKTKIAAPEIGYTFGVGNGGYGKSELLGAMLHMGNDSNLRKLLLGRKWGELTEDGTLDTSRWTRFINRLVADGTLTRKDFDFIQGVWDLTEELKPMAQKTHRDLYGFYFKEVEATPLNTPFGAYRGGYVPAKVDPFMVKDAQRNAKMDALESDFNQVMPSTGLGFTKSRVEYNEPLALDLRMIGKHIDDVIRFAHVQPAIKDVLKLVRNKEFSATLSKIDPTAIETMLLPWLNRAAKHSMTERGRFAAVDRFWSGVRSRTSLAFMCLNLRQLGHLGGIFPSYLKVGRGYMHDALWQYIRDPHETAQAIASLSKMMDERMHNQVGEARERLEDLIGHRTKIGKAEGWARQHGMFLTHVMHNQMDIVTWLGAFNQAIAELGANVNDKDAQREAVARADAAVRLTQGSMNPEDASHFESGTPFMRTLTQFTTYLNTIANLNGDEYGKIVREMGVKKGAGKLIGAHILAFAAPMIIFEATIKLLGGDYNADDDEPWWMEVLDTVFGGYMHGAVGMIPYGSAVTGAIGQISHAAMGDKRAPAQHVETMPAVDLLTSSTTGTAAAAHNLVTGKELTGRNIRDTLTMMSLMSGIPLTPIGKAVGYEMDVERGKIRPTGDIDYLRGILTGTKSPTRK